jgi:dolichyl-phosphate beta-glucosyltransferase
MNIALSLILPAYNAAKILETELPGIIQYLRSEHLNFEVIVVDDGSKDQALTRDVCLANGCIFYGLKENSGKGTALRKGFTLAKGNYQVFTDCDLPFSYGNLLNVFKQLQSGDCQLVIGDRTHSASRYYLEINWIRKWGSNLISTIGSKLLQGHIQDTQCGLKGFTKEAAGDLFPETITHRFGIDFELLFLATRKNYLIHRIPVELRVTYPSTLKIFRDGIFTVAEIFKAIMKHGRSKKKR